MGSTTSEEGSALVAESSREGSIAMTGVGLAVAVLAGTSSDTMIGTIEGPLIMMGGATISSRSESSSSDSSPSSKKARFSFG